MILALKTSDDTTHLWLYASISDQVPTAELSWHSGRSLADQLLQGLTEFVEAHTEGLTALTGIVVFSGPGSFTSLRIGHTVANALADSLAIPVAGAIGPDWIPAALTVLASTPTGQPALPHYGAEANITKPKT